MKGTLLIDFDGTLCDMTKVAPGYKMGPPMAGALGAVTRLTQERRCVVFTVRANTPAGTRAVQNWLSWFKFPPMSVTAIKQDGDILDNRAYHFTNWTQALEALRG